MSDEETATTFFGSLLFVAAVAAQSSGFAFWPTSEDKAENEININKDKIVVFINIPLFVLSFLALYFADSVPNSTARNFIDLTSDKLAYTVYLIDSVDNNYIKKPNIRWAFLLE